MHVSLLSRAQSRFARTRRILSFAGAALLLALHALGAAARLSAEEESVAPAWEYRVTLDSGLATMHVHACFPGFRPKRLVLGEAAGVPCVSVVAIEGEPPSFVPGEGGWVPTEAPSGDCVDYTVDLARLSEGAGKRGAFRVGHDLVADVGLWLLRPGLVPPGTRATVTFPDLPPGMNASVPWQRTLSSEEIPSTPGEPQRHTEKYSLDETAFAFLGVSAFGRFQPSVALLGGAGFEWVVLDAPMRATEVGIRRWISTAAGAVADLYGGKIPVPHVQIIVRPVPGGNDDPVPFGRAVQGGGAGLSLLLASQAKDESLPGEWVAVHEMTHLCMPVMAAEDAWFSEGFVTYYQEVLRARAKAQTPLTAWQQIENGFGRGRSTGGQLTLAEESRRMHETHAYFRVYWAGAAIALLADVEVRKASGGTQSLDDVMRFLASPREGPAKSFSASELIAEADRRLGRPVLSTLAARWLAAKEFPEVGDAYRWLGLLVKGDRVSIEGGAPGSPAADVIMSPPGAALPAK